MCWSSHQYTAFPATHWQSEWKVKKHTALVSMDYHYCLAISTERVFQYIGELCLTIRHMLPSTRYWHSQLRNGSTFSYPIVQSQPAPRNSATYWWTKLLSEWFPRFVFSSRAHFQQDRPSSALTVQPAHCSPHVIGSRSEWWTHSEIYIIRQLILARDIPTGRAVQLVLGDGTVCFTFE